MGNRVLYGELRKANPTLADELEEVCREGLKIWSEQYLRTFTAHGRPHIEQVEANLDALTRPLQNGTNHLSPQEIYVLLAACYLHDIGMQLDQPDARAEHAQYAYELILYSFARVGPDERRVTLSITDDNSREAIALIARAHWTEFALQLDRTVFLLGNVRGRLRLLGSLLAAADLLDLSPVRARYYRTVHRLYDLSAVAELHQTMHRWVRGFTLEAANAGVPGDLQFKVTWRDNHQEVRDTADWVLRWFTSQWRQLRLVIHDESGGSIRWSDPWLKVIFENPIGPCTRLSPHAYCVLQAERAEQRRLDRQVFADSFKKALTANELSLFIMRSDSDWDGQALRDWCASHVSIHQDNRVARMNVPPGGRLDLVSMVAQVLEQWGEHLPVCSEDTALGRFRGFLDSASTTCVALIATDDYSASGVEPIIRAMLSRRGVDTASRVCVLLSDGAVGPAHLDGVQLYRLCEIPYSADDILTFLQGQLGYGERDSKQRLGDIEVSRNLRHPAIVLDMIERREADLLGLD